VVRTRLRCDRRHTLVLPARATRRAYDRPVLRSVLYWAAVLAVSLAFVIVLILFFESRDQSGIGGGVVTPPAPALF